MSGFMISKSIGVVNAYRKPIVVVTIVAIVMVIPVASGKEPVKASAHTSAETGALSERIKQLVKELEYPDKVAQDFINMVLSWKDKQGPVVLLVWKKRLTEAKEDLKQGKISKAQLAKVEESTAKELSQRIRAAIPRDGQFDLSDVIKDRKAQCLGYVQLICILGNSIGLSTKPIEVTELVSPGPIPGAGGHIACLVVLVNGKVFMVDLSFGPIISKPFLLQEEFAKGGNFWELKTKDNPRKVLRRVRILNRMGLIANIYFNTGLSYYHSEQYTRAFSYFNNAVRLDPNFARAYNNRGLVYEKLGELPKEISDYTYAIKLDPKYAGAYINRGSTYVKSGKLQEGIFDLSKAITLDPKDPNGYLFRGMAYRSLSQYTQAISDFSQVIKLNPEDPPAYVNRGISYAYLRKYEKARKDLLRALELDPSVESLVKMASDHFRLNLKLD